MAPKAKTRKYTQRAKPRPPIQPGNGAATGNNGGAPTLYRKEYNEQVAKLARLGATTAEVADFFGVTMQTICNWQSAHPEFFESMRLGRGTSDERMERSFYQRGIGYNITVRKVISKADNGDIVTDTEMHIPGDPTVQAKWLSSRKKKQWGADLSDTAPERSSEEVKAIILGKLAEWGLKVVPVDSPPLVLEGDTPKTNGSGNDQE